MTTPTTLPVGATAIVDRATGNELKPNADGSLNVSGSFSTTPPAMQRVDAQANDFLTGSIVDLLTLLTLTGTSGDANTVNTVMGRLTKIRDLLNGTLSISGSVVTAGTVTEANSAAILAKLVSTPALEGGNLATLVTQTLTPNTSDRWARQLGQVDVARVLGATLSATNPFLTKVAIQALISNGQGFLYTSGKQNNAAGTPTCGFSLFNPAGSGKTIQLYSLRTAFQGSNMLTQLYKVTSGTDPALATSGTKANSQIGNATTSVANCTYVNANQAVPTSTEIDDLLTSSTSTSDYLTNNATIELLQGEGIYVAVNTPASGTTSNWFVTAKGVEY